MEAVTPLERDSHGTIILPVSRITWLFTTAGNARQLIEIANTLPQHEAVIFDWTGVDAVTGAFADEFASWFLSTRRRVASQSMNDAMRRAWELAWHRTMQSGGESSEAG